MSIIFNFIGLSLLLIAIAREYFPFIAEKHKQKFLTLTLFLALSSFLLQIYFDHLQTKKEQAQKWSGHLESPIASNEEFSAIAIGGTESKFVYTGPSNKPAFKFSNDKLFTKLINGKAVISINVRDKEGNLLVAIDDNHWLSARPPMIFDRNYNSNALEIIDAKGEPVFQIEIIGNVINLAFNAKDKGNSFGPWLHETKGYKSTLFKYPSSDFLGVLNNKK